MAEIKEFQFAPLQEFEWRVYNEQTGEEKLIAQYLPGQTYNCTRYPQHDALREMCKDWERRKLIQVLALPPGHHFILNTVTVET